MIELHTEIVKKNGSQFVLVPYEEFAALRELLADYEDLLELRAAKREEQAEPSTPLAEVKSELGF